MLLLFYSCCLLLLPFFQTRFGWLALLFKLPFPASARTGGCSGCTLKHTNVVPKTSLLSPRWREQGEQTPTPSLTSESSYAHLLTAFLQPDSHFMCCWYAKQLLPRGQRVDEQRAWCVYTNRSREDLFLVFILGLMFFITPLSWHKQPLALLSSPH